MRFHLPGWVGFVAGRRAGFLAPATGAQANRRLAGATYTQSLITRQKPCQPYSSRKETLEPDAGYDLVT